MEGSPVDVSQPLTKLYIPSKHGDTPLKRSMSGYEMEFMVCDNTGKLDHSDKLMKAAKKSKLDVEEEVSTNMVEVSCLPHRRLSSSSITLLDNISRLHQLAQKNDLMLYPFGTYPGKNKPVFRKGNEWYTMLHTIFGKRSHFFGQVTGFHQHYALPRGLFDRKTKFLNYKVKSKIKRTLLDSYNFLVAADPAISCLLQSSPYAEGVHKAKDMRVLMWRGGEVLKYPGLYGKHQFYGALSPYKNTMQDLVQTLRRRHMKYSRLMKKHGFPDSQYHDEKYILQVSRNPIKVSANGTLEMRSGDTNMMTSILAASTMIKFALRKIQQDFTLVIPMDMDIKDAFKEENNLVFIPPHTDVRRRLQRAGAYKGLADKEMHHYVKAFMKFAKRNVYPEYQHLLKPAEKMIESKKTMSDKILRWAKRRGYGDEIDEEGSRELALHFGKQWEKDLGLAREALVKAKNAGMH